MNPNAKKRKPAGTKITLGGKNKAAKKVKRINNTEAPKGATRVDRVNLRRRTRAEEINKKRDEKARKRGDVKEVVTKKKLSNATTDTRQEVVTPASEMIKTRKVYKADDVRGGDSKEYGKERPKGVAPDPNHPLQKALAKGRAEGKETIMYNGKKYKAGHYEDEEYTEKKPAVLKTVTTNTPAKYSTKKTTEAVYKKKLPRLKTVKSKKGKGKAVPVNAVPTKVKY